MMKLAPIVLVLCLVLAPLPVASQVGDREPETSEVPEASEFLKKLGVADGEVRLPGVSFTEGLSQMTGVAISPLLGVSGLGAWNYLRTPPENRHLLPWICHPLFWGIGFALLALCLCKDTLGTAAPALAKKPLDLAELFESKVSALVAGGAFVPFLAQQYSRHAAETGGVADGAESVGSGGTLAAGAPGSPLLAAIEAGWLLLPIALAGFFVVWVVSHVINVLIILSPFGLVDAALKLFRLFVLSSLVGLYLLSPVLAAVLSGILIVVCAFLAPSALRFTLYGSVISLDLLRSLVWRSPADPERIHCFLARGNGKKWKAQTLGRLEPCGDGRFRFRSRKLLLGRRRSVRLPEGAGYTIIDGLLFPSLELDGGETTKTRTVVHFLPRYRHCPHALGEILGIGCRGSTMSRGFRAARKWSAEQLRNGYEKIRERWKSPGLEVPGDPP